MVLLRSDKLDEFWACEGRLVGFQQGHGTGDMRGSHGGAVEGGVEAIGHGAEDLATRSGEVHAGRAEAGKA